MDRKICKQLSDQILELESSISSDDYGLYTGKMGLSLTCFVFSDYFSSIEFKNKGDKVLDDIIENIGSVDLSRFDSGLLGIGWAIEWLNQNNYLEINTHEYLSELDDLVYKLILSKSSDISLSSGTLGQSMYLLARLRALSHQSFYREVCLKECLVLLIDNLYEKIVSAEKAILNQAPLSIGDDQIRLLADVLAFSCKILPERYNYYLVYRMVHQIVDFSVQILSNQNLSDESPYLIFSLYRLGEILRSSVIKNKAIFYYNTNKLLFRKKEPEMSYIVNQISAEKSSIENNKSVFGILQTIKGLDQRVSWREAWLLG